jgi:hypothetical protein
MSSVGPLASGFKQTPAGGYVTVLSTIATSAVLQAPVKSGSGGAATVAAPAAYAWPATSNISSLLTAGHVLKDMGSVAVSSSRVFRKFKAVSANSSANGDATTSISGDFGSFYLEVAGNGGDALAPSALARF